MPEPDGEAVIGVPERDVDAELVHDPWPKSKSPAGDAARGGTEACQAIGWAVACVMNGDRDSQNCNQPAHAVNLTRDPRSGPPGRRLDGVPRPADAGRGAAQFVTDGYSYEEPDDVVLIVAFQDARSSAAATAS